MEWPKGIFDDRISLSGRWILHGVGVCIALLLTYDLFANMGTNHGIVRWFNAFVLGGFSIKISYLLLALIGIMGALCLAFVWDFLTSHGSFVRRSNNPYEILNASDRNRKR